MAYHHHQTPTPEMLFVVAPAPDCCLCCLLRAARCAVGRALCCGAEAHAGTWPEGRSHHLNV